MNQDETNKVYSPLWHQIYAIVRAGGDYYAIATEIEQLLSPPAVTTNSAQEEVFTLLDAVEKRLNPEYGNDVYTWHKIKEVLEDEVTKLSDRLSPVAVTTKDVAYEAICPVCGGDGRETCTNPDHGFYSMVGGVVSANESACPCCGHDPDHKVPNGGKCEECNGTGKISIQQPPAVITDEEIIRVIHQYPHSLLDGKKTYFESIVVAIVRDLLTNKK